ncbi:MAG: hypothetical protein ACK4IK_01800 [Bacteroidia bacterium]
MQLAIQVNKLVELKRGENNVTVCMIYAVSKVLQVDMKDLFDF